MERDFLGAIDRAGKGGEAVEEESRTEPDSPAATQWQFAAKPGAAPAFMSFRTAAADEGSETFSVSELRPAGDAFDGVKKQSSLPSIYQQRQFELSSQVTAQAQQYPAAAHGQRSQGATDYGAAAPHRLPVPGGCRLVQPVSVRHPVPLNQANLMARSQSFHNQQPFTMSNGFGGSTVGVYGARNPRNQTSTQLTIFYNGSVNVFDNVPVDKAKELMMLASRASVPTPTPSGASRKPDSPPVSAPARVSVAEVFPAARQIVVQKPEPCVPHIPSTATASPVPIVVPQAVALSRSTSHCATEACGSKPAAAPTSQAVSSQPLATASAAAAVTPRAVPQARKASLARFLEKRKERVVSVEPYPASKSPLESSDTVGSAGAPTKSSSTDVVAPESNNGGAELVRHGSYRRNISFSTNLHI